MNISTSLIELWFINYRRHWYYEIVQLELYSASWASFYIKMENFIYK